MMYLKDFRQHHGIFWNLRWGLFRHIQTLAWKICPEPESTILRRGMLKYFTTKEGVDDLVKDLAEELELAGEVEQ